MPESVLIVGAGISGLLAARALTAAGARVRVFDKGRGVGGRMATRRIGAARLDHGAQYFTADDPVFRSLVSDWTRRGISVPWPLGVDAGGTEGERQAYRGSDGMSAVPKFLARGLDVVTNCRIARVEHAMDGYRAVAEDGSAWNGRAVLVTAPVPQGLGLLKEGRVEVPAPASGALHAVNYDPCLALLAVLAGPSAVAAPGGTRCSDGPIAWVADNTQKGISPKRSAVTIHATAEYSRSRFAAAPERVSAELLEAATPFLGSAVEETQVHRWLYAFPVHQSDPPFVVVRSDPPLAFAGDAFGGACVQGAALSGLAAAGWLCDQLQLRTQRLS